MTFYDAFAGIGGFRYGLEKAGFKCVGSCEIDNYARKVYYKNFGEWPDKDIREVKNINEANMLCGGFPCQDISLAGKGAGLSGKRSGLWWELARLIEDCQPSWVFLENVPALTHRGLGDILKTLATCGYNAEWDCIPASAFGAPHRRDRIWLVAYTNSKPIWQQSRRSSRKSREDSIQSDGDGKKKYLANSNRHRLETAADIGASRSTEKMSMWNKQMPTFTEGCGVADGVPFRMDRLKCLGNAVVPQVVEWIGRQIKEKVT